VGKYILNMKIALFLTPLSFCNILVILLQFYYKMREGLKKAEKSKRNILSIL